MRRLLAHELFLPFLLALASRVLFSCALLAGAMDAPVPAGAAEGSLAGRAFLAWDGWWYASIATTGYHAAPVIDGYHDVAFFPLWPALLAVGTTVLPVAVAAALLANGLFVVAILVAYRAFAPTFGRERTLGGLALLAFGPAAYVFSLGYSESLFLLLVALAFVPALRRPRPGVAFLASLTRLTGPALSAMALAGPLTERRRPTRDELALLVAGPLAFVAWCAAIAGITGDPLGYLRGSPSWYAGTGLPTGALSFVAPLVIPQEAALRLVAGVGLALPLLGTLVLLRERRWEMAAYCIAALIPTLLFATWSSMPRHALVALPAFIALVPATPRRAQLGVTVALLALVATWLALLTVDLAITP
ncbi:MAG: hypothetical protein ACKOTZ_09205 [Chloroflexota bacterium]